MTTSLAPRLVTGREPVAAFVQEPPHSLEVERALLGGLLAWPEALDDVAAMLTPEDFYARSHRATFAVLLDMRTRRVNVDAATVLDELAAVGALEDLGGRAGLHEIARAAIVDADPVDLARRVRDKAQARHVIETARRLSQQAYEGSLSGPALVDAMRAATTMLERDEASNTVTVRGMLDEAFNEITATTFTRGIGTGFHALDGIIETGFEAGQLVLVGARPGMGKTAFLLNLGRAMIGCSTTVGFLSFEMTRRQLMRRLLSAQTGIPMNRLRGGVFLAEHEETLLNEACEALKHGCAHLVVDDSSGPTTSALRSKCRTLVEKHGCQLLFVDHLGLIRPPTTDRTIRSTVDVVSHVSRELKALAVDLKVPVIAACQLNREAAKGHRNRKGSSEHDTSSVQDPTLTDLRDSGSLEQDADMVLLLHRDGYYTKDPHDHVARVIVAKQRDGETGVAKLAWAGHCQRFEPIDPTSPCRLA